MCLFHTFVISLPFFLFQNNTDKEMKMGQSSCYALGVLLYWATWNSSYLWGNAFVFSLWKKERHSLQSRIRQKSSVEVLCCRTPLKGAESSAHCCGFFTVTSDKDLFFFLRGRVCSSWTNAGGWNEPSAAARKRKTNNQKKKIWYFSPLHFERPVATDTMTSGVLWSATNNAERFIVKHRPHPTLPTVVSQQLPSATSKAHGALWKTKGEVSSAVLSTIILPCQHKHLFSGFCWY